MECVKEINGYKMVLLPQDKGLSTQLIEDGIREVASTRYTQKILKKHWACLDVGANLGYYALMEAQRCKYVYAVEPVIKSYKTLNKAIEINGFKNISTYNLALSSKVGKSKIRLSKKYNWSAMVDVDKYLEDRYGRLKNHETGYQDIETTTLDDFTAKYKIDRVDFIRMDVEGFEIEIMGGADRIFDLMPIGSFIAMEMHPSLFKDRSAFVRMTKKIFRRGFTLEHTTRKHLDMKMTRRELFHRLAKGKFSSNQVFFKRIEK